MSAVAPVVYPRRVGDDYEVFERLRPDLLALARTLLRGSRLRLEPEDLVQTILTKIFAALHGGGYTLSSIESPRRFAFRALKNQFLDEVQRFCHTRELLHLERDGAPPEPAAPVAGAPDQVPELANLLAKLAPHERCFLLRVVFEERSVEEAQRLCGWPPRSPFYHYRALLARLAGLLDEGAEQR